MKTRQIKIVDILSERKDWVTGKELSAILEVSDRTIRSDINAINCELHDVIEASVRYGYRLKEDASGVNQIKNDDLIPQSLEERCNFLIKRLFRYKKINIIDLQNEIYYSTFTIRNDIKHIRKMLEAYPDLSIVENGEVIYLQGSEESKRQFHKDILVHETKGDFININKIAGLFPDFDLLRVSKVLEETLNTYNYKLRAETIPMLMIHIGVGIQRMMDFNCVDMGADDERIKGTVEYQIAHEFFTKITKFLRCEINENEIVLLARLLMGRQHNRYISDTSLLDNSVVLLNRIIAGINEVYDVDFSNDEFFKDGLLIHIQHLLKRLETNTRIQNVYLHDVKKQYPMVFDVSVFVGKIIEDYMHVTMVEDEIGFLAIHLGAAYDRLNLHQHYYHAVLIQPNNQLMTSMCADKIKHRFGDRLVIDATVRVYEENVIKRLKPDIIISTVNVKHTLDIPTVIIGMFFNEDDEYKIFRLINDLDHQRQALEFSDQMQHLLTDEFFFKDLECESYEDVINQLCDALYGAGRVSEVFKESTFEREKMAWTSLSYGFAIPHPLKYSTIKTTVAVASLKKPVQWGNFKVKFVMLLAVKEEDKDILRIFFDWFSNVCDDPVLLSQITVAQNVNELMELMTK